MSTIKESWLKPTKDLRDCENMDDKISQLPDELLLKILLFLPTKVAVSTSVLSKRWEFLWMWLSKLEYNSIEQENYYNLPNFIDLNLPLHRAPVIESFCLKFRNESSSKAIKPAAIKMWVLIAVSRCVRELILDLCRTYKYNFLPSSLYTCTSLVILKLIDNIMVDVPRMACLPSLKTLFLQRVTYSNENSLHQLLSSCPVLEDLVLERRRATILEGRKWRVIVPSLQKLTLTLKITRCSDDFDELMINTPSLKYFKVKDYKDEYVSDNDDDSYSFKFKDMPKLKEADIDSTYPDMDKFVRSITYVKRLSLCIRVNAQEDLYPEGIVFNHLEHLKLCPCHSNWSKLLVRLLKDSPNLRELEVSLNDDHTKSSVDPPVCWENQLNSVPECLLSSLETFKWTGIHGLPKVMDLAKYILRNASCLKTATILFQSALETEDERETMIQDLLLSIRSSSTCQHTNMPTHTTIMISFI